MFYGLTQKEDTYFADKVNKAIFLAPCIFTYQPIEEYTGAWPLYRSLGINSMIDANWADDQVTICTEASESWGCTLAGFLNPPMQTNSVKSFETYGQIANSNRFQVYKPDFAVGNFESDLVTPGLESIDRVPI